MLATHFVTTRKQVLYTYLYYPFIIFAVGWCSQPPTSTALADPTPYPPLWMNPFGPYPPNLHFLSDQVESLTNMLPPYSIRLSHIDLLGSLKIGNLGKCEVPYFFLGSLFFRFFFIGPNI